jgi:hypothetical protein
VLAILTIAGSLGAFAQAEHPHVYAADPCSTVPTVDDRWLVADDAAVQDLLEKYWATRGQRYAQRRSIGATLFSEMGSLLRFFNGLNEKSLLKASPEVVPSAPGLPDVIAVRFSAKNREEIFAALEAQLSAFETAMTAKSLHRVAAKLYLEPAAPVIPLGNSFIEPTDSVYLAKQQEMFREFNIIQGRANFQICSWSPIDVTVAVVDSGVRTKHPDLKGAFADCEPLSGGDFDGQVGPPYCGVNVADDRRSIEDLDGHGTALAGIIAAQANERGVAGVGCNVDLVLVRLFSGRKTASTFDVQKALRYIIRRNLDFRIPIANCGWRIVAPPECMILEWALFKELENCTLVVCAAGNDGVDMDAPTVDPDLIVYPAAFSEGLQNIISVTACSQSGGLPPFANIGAKKVQIAAPGVDVYSTSLYSSYEPFTGTSGSTAFIAAAASLLMSEDPNLSPERVRDIICKSARLDRTEWQDLIECNGPLDFGKLYETMTNPEKKASPGLKPGSAKRAGRAGRLNRRGPKPQRQAGTLSSQKP